MMLLMTCNTMEISWFDNAISVIEAVCAIGNLLLLIYFTNREWTYSKNKEQQRENEAIEFARLERQKVWYNKVVIERIMEYLLEYFDSSDKEFTGKKVQEKEEKKEFIEKIKIANRRYKHLVVPCLEIFSHKLTQDVKRLLDDYCEILVDEIGKSGQFYSHDFERNMSNKKGEILKKIYEFDFDTNIKK